MEHFLPHTNCYQVAPRLIAGEYPGAAHRGAALVKLARHLDAGITYFVDLTEAGELVPYADLLAAVAQSRHLTVHHQRFPIRDGSIPHTSTVMMSILDSVDAALAASHTVYIHCWGGVGRTGTVVGCWLVRHGMTGDAALATIMGHWQQMTKRRRHPRSPETDEQHAYVRAWRETGTQ